MKAAQNQAAGMCEAAMVNGRNTNSKIISELMFENSKLKNELSLDISTRPIEFQSSQSARYQLKSKGLPMQQYKMVSPVRQTVASANKNVRKLEGIWISR